MADATRAAQPEPGGEDGAEATGREAAGGDALVRLYGVVAELSAALDREEIGRVAVARAVDHLGAAAAVAYAEVDGRMCLIAQHGLDPDGASNELPRDAPLPLARAIASGAPEFLSTRDEILAAYPQLLESRMPAGALQAVVALPLAIGGRLLGGLAYSFATPQVFDRALYRALAARFAGAMERARLYAELARRAEREAEQARVVETLLATSAILSSELDLDRLFQKLTDEATRLCRAQFGAFFYNTVDDSGEAYLLYTISGAPREAFSRFPSPRNTAMFAPTFRGDGVVRIDDVHADPRFGKNPPYHGMPAGHLPVCSYLAVPVMSASGAVLGGLFFGHADAGVFREEDERLLVAVAAQGAIALDNARLYRDERAARDVEERRARLAESVGIALTGIAPFEDKLGACLDALVERLDLAAGGIWTADRARGVLELRASVGRGADDGSADRIPMNATSAIGRVALARRQLLVDARGLSEVSGLPGWILDAGPACVIAHPLLVEESTVGVLAVSSQHPVGGGSIKLVETVADQVAVAIGRDQGERERERFRELFIGMLGHDLRNPLSAISTGTQALLLSEKLNERSSLSVGRIRTSAARMSRMVNQLLDFARSRDIGSGIPLTPTSADLHAVCHDVVEELRQSYPGRGVVETYDGDAQGAWDVDRMAQVFSNLIGNALSYGDPDQPIHVHIGRGPDQVTAAVKSMGPPIPSDVLPTLFDPFRRAREGRTGKTRGLGLGLYITRQIILAHGGDLEASSAAEEGTTFRLRLPLAPTPE
jgi:signal transduction histidine kinase